MKRLDLEEPEEYNEFTEKKKFEEPELHTQNNKRLIFGGLLIAAGALIVGRRLGILPDFLFHFVFNWQVILIIIGGLMLFNKQKSRRGIILIIIGAAFLIPHYLFIPFGINHLFFPAALILIGVFMIIRHNETYGEKTRTGYANNSASYSQDYIDETYIFGGGNIHVISDNFKGGKYSALFGGGKIDLSHAILSKEKRPILKVDLIFGGAEILIPNDWNVVIKSNSIFGGFGMKKNGIRREQIDMSKEIVIVGNAIFGGGDIKRVKNY